VVAGMLVGPNVIGIIDQNTFIETIGYIGLLYLMFQGGLDLDLDGFMRYRRDSVVFGVVTFVIPMVLVTGVRWRSGSTAGRDHHRVGPDQPHAAQLRDHHRSI
jgi:Kef-type K+ transport system membrane component KefB